MPGHVWSNSVRHEKAALRLVTTQKACAMTVLRLVGWVVSLPLLWVGQLACALKLSWGPKLLAAAWRVGGDGQVAYLALSRMSLFEPAGG